MIIFHIALSSPWSTYREPLSEVLPYLTVSKKTSAMSIRCRERTGPIGPRFFPGFTRLFPRPSSAGEGRDGGKRGLEHALGRNMQQLARIIAQDRQPTRHRSGSGSREGAPPPCSSTHRDSRCS